MPNSSPFFRQPASVQISHAEGTGGAAARHRRLRLGVWRRRPGADRHRFSHRPGRRGGNAGHPPATHRDISLRRQCPGHRLAGGLDLAADCALVVGGAGCADRHRRRQTPLWRPRPEPLQSGHGRVLLADRRLPATDVPMAGRRLHRLRRPIAGDLRRAPARRHRHGDAARCPAHRPAYTRSARHRRRGTRYPCHLRQYRRPRLAVDRPRLPARRLVAASSSASSPGTCRPPSLAPWPCWR